MSGLLSPDIPAFYCYAIVFVFGMMVARSTVIELLAAYPDRWAFVDTWLLFMAHVTLPVLLFWFLDYTGAIQDTSLFAALLVAVGYRQIFAGGVQGISMPGQTPALWRPFEAWVKKIADRIATRNKQYRDRFNEVVKSYLAADATRLANFEKLVSERTTDLNQLTTALGPLRGPNPPPGAELRIVDVLFRDLRSSEPENYGYLLKRRRLIAPHVYWWWFQKGPALLFSVGLGSVALVLLLVALWTTDDNARRTMYYQWRFLKPQASQLDRFRSREFLAGAVGNRPDLSPLVYPLLRELRYDGISTDQADLILRLFIDQHTPKLNAVVIPELTTNLRTTNADVRLRIHNALRTMASADYPLYPMPQVLDQWVPAKDDSPGEIDGFIRSWRSWWASTTPKPSAPPPSS